MSENTIAAIRAHFARQPIERDMRFCPRITCADGFSVSVQASRVHYCAPRETLEDGQYSSVECGFPSALVPEWANWAEEPDTTDTVFAYVPIRVVADVLDAHGGIKE